jgi:hypothetical protein
MNIFPPVRKLLTGVLLVAAVPLAAACGSHHSNLADANNNGTYVKAGPVTYQLQVSRELNPFSHEDSGYLAGLPKKDASLAPDQEWYAVFLWAKNTSKQPQQTTARFDVVDTEGDVYTPIAFNNPYVWTSQTLAPGAVQPQPDTTAGYGPIEGQMLLFKVYSSGSQSVYSNRPLTLRIYGNTGKVWATISLDL